MRVAVVVVAGMLGISGAVVGLLNASAQQFSADADTDGPDDTHGLGGPHRMLGWEHGHGPSAGGLEALQLVFTAPDRQLSQADVQKIAEAFLLWHGNHDWKMVKMATDGDRVTFAVATAANAVVATFAMDKHSGALTRTG